MRVLAVSAIITRCSNLEQARLASMRLIAGFGKLHGPLSEMSDAVLPTDLPLQLRKKQALRYGENPHQKAHLLVGKNPVRRRLLSHGNFTARSSLHQPARCRRALSAVKEFSAPAACIVKHDDALRLRHRRDIGRCVSPGV